MSKNSEKPGAKVKVNAADLEALGYDAETVARMVKAANADQESDGGSLDPDAAAKASEDAAKAAADAAAVKGNTANMVGLSDDQREAVEICCAIRDEKRDGLVSTITANSDMKADSLAGMSMEQLGVIANGLRPAGDYSGRAAAVNINSEDESAKGMVPPTTAEIFAQRRNGGVAKSEAA